MNKIKTIKMLIFSIAIIMSGCVQNEPLYEAPSLISPSGNIESYGVIFNWEPNNLADHTTKDYIFMVEVSETSDFKIIKTNHLTKLSKKYETLPSLFRSGVYYWRVTGSYQGMINSNWRDYVSKTSSFVYNGNDGAIYVNPSVTSTSNLGTKDNPVKTISDAFTVSNIRRVTSIILANNTYSTTISIHSGYSVKGCYDPNTWIRNTATCSTTISDSAALSHYDILN